MLKTGPRRVANAGALTLLSMVALALPALPMSALTIPLVTFLPEFYSSTLGMELGMVGTVFMLVRLFDLGVDPLLGALMDRTVTRWGRFKPWLFGGVPVVMLGVYFLMFARPGVEPFYLTVWLLVTYVGFSIVVLSQLALIAGQTRDYHERSLAFGWWQAAYTGGILCVVSLPLLMAGTAANDRTTVIHGMGWVVLVATPLTVLITCCTVRDTSTAPAHATVRWRDYLNLFRRRSTRLLMATVLMMGLSSGVASALGFIYFLAVKRLTLGDFSLALLVIFGVAVFTAPMWVRVARRMGKHRAYALGALCNVLFFTGVFLMPAGERIGLFLVSILCGLAYGASNQMPRAMMADVNDEELLENGRDRTGMLYAVLTGIDKIGFALAVGVVFQVLAMAGYVPALADRNSPAAIEVVALLYCGATSLMSLCGAVLIMRYPLTQKRHAEIRLALERRRTLAAAGASHDDAHMASVAAGL
jgi:GPH family glycoside/pentoside/hexuronide:cation symporter